MRNPNDFPTCPECGKLVVFLLKTGKCQECNMGKPEPGKQYALTGATGTPCIMNGNTWAESEVK